MSPTDISVVMPTYNSSRTIARCLESIRAQTVKCKELFVVDRQSKDGSKEVALRNGAIVIDNLGNRSVARNIGAKRATARGILFVDSDMILPRTLLQECAQALQTNQALIIPEVSTGSGFWAECKRLERESYSGNSLLEAARCFDLSQFLALGGYNSKLEAGEDWDLQNRVNAHNLVVGRVKSWIVHDEGRITLPSCMRKKYSYGKTIKEYLRLNPNAGVRQVNPFNRILAPAMATFPRHPVHAGGVLLMKSLELAAAAGGHMAGSVSHKE